MSTGEFPKKSVPAIQGWLSRLDRNAYRKEAEKLIAQFFKKGFGMDSHIDMLQATYVRRYEHGFWQLYWFHFQKLLLDETRVREFVRLLSFWFDESLPIFAGQPYLGPSFFLQLPVVIKEARETKEFNRASQRINRYAARQPWYSLISDCFTEKKRGGLFGLFRE